MITCVKCGLELDGTGDNPATGICTHCMTIAPKVCCLCGYPEGKIEHLEEENERLSKQIKLAMETIAAFPTGGIGVEGPTLEDLHRCASEGRCYDGDAGYHVAQEAWRILEKGD